MQRIASPGSRRRRLLFVTVALVLIALVGGIGGFGYYQEFVAPTRVLAVQVDDVTHTQGDLVTRLRMQQAAAVAMGQVFDYGRQPFEVVQDVAEAEIIKRAAPNFNIHVTEDDIEAVLRQRFYPQAPEGQEYPPGQLEREYRANYGRFLERSHLSDEEYTSLVEEDVYRALLREELGRRIPTIAQQVEVHWVKLPSLIDPASTSGRQTDPNETRERLLRENFAAVAREVSTDITYANSNGYVGWVPKGAFPFLDSLLFGTDDTDPLAHGEISQPVHNVDGIYLVKVTGGPEEREISTLMREALKDQALDRWLVEQLQQGTNEGWLKLNNSSSLYSWVVDQLRKAAPDATPPTSSQRPSIR